MTMRSTMENSASQMNDNAEIHSPLLKVASAWALIGVTSWADAAAFLGAVYSALLILEWLWKKIFRPLAVDAGWIKTTPAAADADAE